MRIFLALALLSLALGGMAAAQETETIRDAGEAAARTATESVEAVARWSGWQLFAAPFEPKPMTFFSIGSGDITGGYFETANALCEVINRPGNNDLRCSVDPTAGSVYNLEMLRRGQLQFALVQSDVQAMAVEGSGRYAAAGPWAELRSVMGLYQETVTLIAARNSGITSLSDLKDKVVDIGHPSSGRRATIDRMKYRLGLVGVDPERVRALQAGAAIDAICEGEIDATILVVGHPNPGVARAIAECGATVVPLGPKEMRGLTEGASEFRPAVVLKADYPDLPVDVPTVAVTATLVTRDSVDPGLVMSLVADFVHFRARIAKAAPALDAIRPENLPVLGLTAQLHPAAVEEFRQLGLYK